MLKAVSFIGKHKGEAATIDTVDHIESLVFPKISKDSISQLIDKGVQKEGTKRIAQKWGKMIGKVKGESIVIRNNDHLEELKKINDSVGGDYSPYTPIFENARRMRDMGIENAEMERAALREFIQYRVGLKEADKAKMLERGLIGKNVGQDFFPTPKATAEEMLDKADISEGLDILEPSAGNGNIAEAIRDAGASPDVIEISGNLREILEAKKFNVVAQDFMDYSGKQYDRIIMNPPFSNSQDIEHVRHAYDLLKPGGRIVAIMGEGAFFRSDKKATEFRSWLEEVGGTEEKLPAGTFTDKSLMTTTGVNARMVVIDKGVAMFSRGERREQGEIDRIVSEAKANGTYLKAPNGQPSKLNPFQWAQARTKAFKKWFGDWEAIAINGEFNKNLEKMGKGNLPIDYIFNLGEPSEILINAGVPNYEIVLTQSVLRNKQVQHGLPLSTFKNLPGLINNKPIAIFDAKDQERFPGAKVIVTEIKQGDDYVVAALHVERKRGKLVINEIRSLHSRPDRQYQGWVEAGLLRSIDKNKGQWMLEREGSAILPMTSMSSTLSYFIEHSEKIVKPDSVSKAVDENGEPLVVYRGGNIKNDYSGHAWIFFADTKAAAAKYGKKTQAVFLNIKNPLHSDYAGTRDNDIIYDIEDAKEDGRDGLIAAETDDGWSLLDQYVAFSPTQIKSATENAGTFDGANPDMRFSRDARPEGSPLSREELYDYIGELTSGAKNIPAVTIVNRPSELPFDAPDDAKGAFFNGEAFLVAENITSPEDAREVITHETVGHFGLRGFFGPALDTALLDIHESNPRIKESAAQWRADNTDLRMTDTEYY